MDGKSLNNIIFVKFVSKRYKMNHKEKDVLIRNLKSRIRELETQVKQQVPDNELPFEAIGFFRKTTKVEKKPSKNEYFRVDLKFNPENNNASISGVEKISEDFTVAAGKTYKLFHEKILYPQKRK